jgi:hypothetical protein
MISKKNILLLSICILFYSYVNAQQKTDKDYKWAAGISIGNIFIRGDVTPIKSQFSGSAHLYKPFAKWFGLKLNYTHGNAKGLNYKASENFAKNPAWSDKYAAPYLRPGGMLTYGYISNNTFTPAVKGEQVYYNHKTSINTLSLSACFTLPIPYSNPKFGIHLNIGAGILFYKTKIDALNSNGTNYAGLFKEVFNSNSNGLNSKNIYRQLKNGMDNRYETDAEVSENSTLPTRNLSIGLSYKINSRFVIGIELSAAAVKSDLLDGQRWQEQAYGDAVLTRDLDNLRYNSINISYSF